MSPPELASARLRLLPLAADDAELLLPVYADPEVTEYFEDKVTDIDGVRGAVKQRLDRDVPVGMGTWLIQCDDTVVGHAHLWAAKRPAGIVEVGWTIGKAHWGKGIATEAARMVIDHGFRRLGVPAIFAIVHQNNAASMRVAEKLGFVDVGEQEHHGAPHRMHVLLPTQTGALHHIELRVTDLAVAEAELGWLFGELGWVAGERWPDGVSWRLGQLSVAVRAVAEHHFGLTEGDSEGGAGPAPVRRDVLALSVGDSARLSALTTAAVERGWQLIAIDHVADADGPGRQVAHLEAPDGLAIEFVADDAPEELLEGFGPGAV